MLTRRSRSEWSAPTTIDGTNQLNSISCTDETFCAAVDDVGNALTYNGTTKTSQLIDSSTSLTSVSCPKATFCVAVDTAGYVFYYNSTAKVAQYTDPMGNVTSYTYTGNRNSALGGWDSVTKANGDVSEYIYVYGELISKTSYGSNTQIGSQQNTNPATTGYVRDPGTLLATSKTGPDGNTTTYAYDTNGNLCWSAPYAVSSPSCGSPPAPITNPPAGPTVYAYNSLGERSTMTQTVSSTAQDVITYAYDSNGNLCWSAPYAVSSPSCGSPPAAITNPPAGPTVYTYNSLAKPTTVKDPMGNVTTYAYNAVGEACWSAPYAVSSPSCGSPPPAPITNPAAGPTVYTYDANGNRIMVTDPMGYQTSNAYDAKGELCWSAPVGVSSPACASPPASATVYTYDALGNRTQVSTATLNEHGETFNVSTAGTNAMATLCVASRSCQGRKSSM